MPNIIDLKNQPPQKQPDPGKQKNDSLEWKALEFTPRDRSREWFWGIGIVGGGISIFSLIIGNFLFSLLVILAIFLLFLYEIRGPREYEFGITPRGVRTQNRLFEFAHLDSFWIFEHENGEKELSILSQKTFVPNLKIPLGAMEAKTVRSVLKKYLPEKHHEESLIDILARRFGV